MEFFHLLNLELVGIQFQLTKIFGWWWLWWAWFSGITSFRRFQVWCHPKQMMFQWSGQNGGRDETSTTILRFAIPAESFCSNPSLKIADCNIHEYFWRKIWTFKSFLPCPIWPYGQWVHPHHTLVVRWLRMWSVPWSGWTNVSGHRGDFSSWWSSIWHGRSMIFIKDFWVYFNIKTTKIPPLFLKVAIGISFLVWLDWQAHSSKGFGEFEATHGFSLS